MPCMIYFWFVCHLSILKCWWSKLVRSGGLVGSGGRIWQRQIATLCDVSSWKWTHKGRPEWNQWKVLPFTSTSHFFFADSVPIYQNGWFFHPLKKVGGPFLKKLFSLKIFFHTWYSSFFVCHRTSTWRSDKCQEKLGRKKNWFRQVIPFDAFCMRAFLDTQVSLAPTHVS